MLKRLSSLHPQNELPPKGVFPFLMVKRIMPSRARGGQIPFRMVRISELSQKCLHRPGRCERGFEKVDGKDRDLEFLIVVVGITMEKPIRIPAPRQPLAEYAEGDAAVQAQRYSGYPTAGGLVNISPKQAQAAVPASEGPGTQRRIDQGQPAEERAGRSQANGLSAYSMCQPHQFIAGKLIFSVKDDGIQVDRHPLVQGRFFMIARLFA